MLQAQRLLETSDYSVDEVAGRCGFRSPVALRGHFRRQLGSSPAAYRAAYRARRPQTAATRTMTGNDEPEHARRPRPRPATPGDRSAGDGDGHGMTSAAPARTGRATYADADAADTRAAVDRTTEPGRPESDAWSARVPGTTRVRG